MKRTILAALFLAVITLLITYPSKSGIALESSKSTYLIGIYVTYSDGSPVTSGTLNVCGANGQYSATISNGYASIVSIADGEYCAEGVSGNFSGVTTINVVQGHIPSTTIVVSKSGPRCSNCTGN